MVVQVNIVMNLDLSKVDIGELSDVESHIHWLIREELPKIKNSGVTIAVPMDTNEDLNISMFDNYRITKKVSECDDEYTLWKIINKKYIKIKTLFNGTW